MLYHTALSFPNFPNKQQMLLIISTFEILAILVDMMRFMIIAWIAVAYIRSNRQKNPSRTLSKLLVVKKSISDFKLQDPMHVVLVATIRLWKVFCLNVFSSLLTFFKQNGTKKVFAVYFCIPICRYIGFQVTMLKRLCFPQNMNFPPFLTASLQGKRANISNFVKEKPFLTMWLI